MKPLIKFYLNQINAYCMPVSCIFMRFDPFRQMS